MGTCRRKCNRRGTADDVPQIRSYGGGSELSAQEGVDMGKNHVKSVGRAARLLIALADEGAEVSLTELGDRKSVV